MLSIFFVASDQSLLSHFVSRERENQRPFFQKNKLLYLLKNKKIITWVFDFHFKFCLGHPNYQTIGLIIFGCLFFNCGTQNLILKRQVMWYSCNFFLNFLFIFFSKWQFIFTITCNTTNCYFCDIILVYFLTCFILNCLVWFSGFHNLYLCILAVENVGGFH